MRPLLARLLDWLSRQDLDVARDLWSVPWLDKLMQDLRYALRGLRRSPGFAVTIVLTLGIGIGANTAIFGVVDRLMFGPYPYLRDPGTVDRVYLRTAGWARDNAYTVFPYTRYRDLKQWTTSFSQYAAFVNATHGVGTGGDARQRAVQGVTASFFEFFDARPVLGRFFGAAEDSLPGANVAVLGFDFWNELGRRNVLGESIQVGNVLYTIIGVAPEGFVGVSEESRPALFVPIMAYGSNQGGGSAQTYTVNYDWDWVQMMVRRKPGVDRAAATADLTQAFLLSWASSRTVHPRYRTAELSRPRAEVSAMKRAAGPDASLEARTLLWVAGVAMIVLLIACANVANLLLARARRQKRELALRLALGVSRGRLAAQALTETTVVAAFGCITGIAIAEWGGGVLRRLFVPDASGFAAVTQWRTLAVSVAAALLAALVTGLVPVLAQDRANVADALKAGARAGTYRRSRARTALLVLQGTLSVVLLVGAGLFVRSLVNVRSLRLGYDTERVLLAQWEGRGTPMDSSGRGALRARLLETALARPDVERGAWTSNAPFASGTNTQGLSVPGIDSVAQLGRFTIQIVSADYFATMDTRILRGRSFTDADRVGAPLVAVVSEAMAATLWPHRDALGQCLRVGHRSARADTMPCSTVIGIAENAVHDPAADLPLRYYQAESQINVGASWLLLRMRGDPARAAEAVRRELQALMPGQALVTVRLPRDLMDAKRRSWLVGATMFVGFGLLALIVAAVGLYGVVAYDVAQRMHELGVRMALGAQRADLVRHVLAHGARLAVAGLGIGSALALAVARWVQPLLFQQSARDPMIFTAVAAILLAVALAASGVPAWRASRADPSRALRSE